MELLHLRVHDFRNLVHADVQPGRRFNVISGQNGHGKTNFVEAVYLLGTVKTFRSQKNKELVRWGAHTATVEARIERGDDERIARVEISAQHKKIFLQDMPVGRIADFFGTMNVVVFTPDDLSLVKAGPGTRRRFIDRAIFNATSSYAADAVRYDQLVRQRNALLREGRYDPVLLDIYDDQLALLGARVAEARRDFAQAMGPLVTAAFQQIFGERKAEIRYDAPWWQQESAGDSLRDALSRHREDDARRGTTSAGPHRDDLRIDLDERPARIYASQGQQRALVLALKIAEMQLFDAQKGFRPILLLDDVSSELDKQRNAFLFEHLCAQSGQVFITTTHRDHISLSQDTVFFEMTEGEIARVE